MGSHTWRGRKSAARWAACAVLVLLMGGCASDVVRPPDCFDCRPVEVGMDQVLEVELGGDLALGRPQDPEAYTWVLTDAGTMKVVSEERVRHSEDPDEFVGGYSYAMVWTLEPTAAGSTQVQFRHVSTEDPDQAIPGSRSPALEVIVSD